ncbi:unnamed protein product, partial [marine sediment metagenome]
GGYSTTQRGEKELRFGYTLAGGDFTGPSGFAWMVSFEV